MKSSFKDDENAQRATPPRISKGAILFVVAFLIFASASLYILTNRIPKSFDDPSKETVFSISQAIAEVEESNKKGERADLESEEPSQNETIEEAAL